MSDQAEKLGRNKGASLFAGASKTNNFTYMVDALIYLCQMLTAVNLRRVEHLKGASIRQALDLNPSIILGWRGLQGQTLQLIANIRFITPSPGPSFRLYKTLHLWHTLSLRKLLIRSNLELKTRAKQLLGCLRLDIPLPKLYCCITIVSYIRCHDPVV